MAIDYSERRQVSRNRPKKRPFMRYLFLITGCLAAVYGLGIATGWLLFRTKQNAPMLPVKTAATKDAPRPSAQPADKAVSPPAAAPGVANEVPLTFYHTLPKGDKGVLGSGLNPPHDEKKAVAKNVPSAAPAAQKDKVSSDGKSPATTVQEGKTPSDKEKTTEGKSLPSGEKKQSKPGSRGYSVQIASYHVRKEAEDVKANLEKNGFAARIVESTVPGKGTLYRVRVGNGMDQEAAKQLSVKVGRGAIAVPE